MGNLYQHTHTYANIQREKCFCINFLPVSTYDRLVETINSNGFETDEFAAGNFTPENAKTIHDADTGAAGSGKRRTKSVCDRYGED